MKLQHDVLLYLITLAHNLWLKADLLSARSITHWCKCTITYSNWLSSRREIDIQNVEPRCS